MALFGTFLPLLCLFVWIYCFHFHMTKNWLLSFKPPEAKGYIDTACLPPSPASSSASATLRRPSPHSGTRPGSPPSPSAASARPCSRTSASAQPLPQTGQPEPLNSPDHSPFLECFFIFMQKCSPNERSADLHHGLCDPVLPCDLGYLKNN